MSQATSGFIFTFIVKQQGIDLTTHLRRQKKQRKCSIKAQNRRNRMLNKPSIHERSAVIEERQRTGNFEGDTIIGHDHNIVKQLQN